MASGASGHTLVGMRNAIPSIDWRRGKAGAPAAAGSGREDRSHLADALRAAVGFRVYGPEGRIGVLTAVGPHGEDGLPQSITIATGLFVVRSVQIPFASVVDVDPVKRRVDVRVGPERARVSPRQIALRVHRFLRAGGR
jgi:hypothetical protein